jgi:hypothetical protein
MIMKKAVVPLGLALALSFASFSQTLSSNNESEAPVLASSVTKPPVAATDDNQKEAKLFVKNLNEEMTITQQQKADLYQAELEKNIKLQKIEADFEAQMKSVLTEAQFAKWKSTQSNANKYIYNP